MTAGEEQDRPGLHPGRLARLCAAAIERTGLDLRDRVVVTEAATGSFAVTPVLAAMAGAREVRAVAKDSRYGPAEEAVAQVGGLADRLGVRDRIRFARSVSPGLLAGVDVVTNSGHLRPIDAQVVSWCRPGAAVSLMYEPWELRDGEVDLAACRARGLRVAGTNEHHPDVDVFGYSGVMAVKQLLDAGIPAYGSTVLLLCDNVFRSDIVEGLRAVGAHVVVAERPGSVTLPPDLDAVLVALHPRPGYVLDAEAIRRLALERPGAAVVQFWGDVDRAACAAAGVAVWPSVPPARGHMGVLPSAVGPDAVIALQAAGLKVGEILTLRRRPTAAEIGFLAELPGVMTRPTAPGGASEDRRHTAKAGR